MLAFFLAMIEDEDDKVTFEKIYHKHCRVMLNMAYGITGNAADAEAALSDALYKIAKCIKTIDVSDETKEQSYVHRIVKNAAIDIVRKRKKSRETELDENIIPSVDDEDIEKIIEGDESYVRTVKIIYRMPEKYKDVLMLRYLNNMSYKEISAQLNLCMNTVKIRISRGTQILRKVLREENVCQ